MVTVQGRAFARLTPISASIGVFVAQLSPVFTRIRTFTRSQLPGTGSRSATNAKPDVPTTPHTMASKSQWNHRIDHAQPLPHEVEPRALLRRTPKTATTTAAPNTATHHPAATTNLSTRPNRYGLECSLINCSSQSATTAMPTAPHVASIAIRAEATSHRLVRGIEFIRCAPTARVSILDVDE